MSKLLQTAVGNINKLPVALQKTALTRLFNTVVPYTGTSGVIVHKLTAEECIVEIKNKRKARNHIGSIHAVAMALIAETATGYPVAMSLSDKCVPVIKTLKMDYQKRIQGALTAHAKLTAEQTKMIKEQEKGEVTVAVTLTDESGREPVQATMTWAWTPKRRA